MPAPSSTYEPSTWPDCRNWKADHWGLPGSLPLSVILGSSQAVHLSTWKAESESQGCIHPAVCGHRARERWLPEALKNASTRTKGTSRSPPPLASHHLSPATTPQPPRTVRSVAPVPRSGLRVFADASSLGRRGERLAVALGTSPRPRRAEHDSERRALGLPRSQSGFWCLRKTAVAIGEGRPRRKVCYVFLFLLIEV